MTKMGEEGAKRGEGVSDESKPVICGRSRLSSSGRRADWVLRYFHRREDALLASGFGGGNYVANVCVIDGARIFDQAAFRVPHMGRHDDRPRASNAHCARRACRVRTRINPRATRRLPRAHQPRSGAILVLTQVSSMKTRRLGSILS
jgi:hypothetical protein